MTARKFVLRLTRDELLAALTAARQAGAAIATRPGESLGGLVDRMAPLFFDAAFDPILTNKTPGEGRDILEASSNNLYAGVTMSALETFRGTLRLELAPGQAQRPAGRGRVSRRRPLRPSDPPHHRTSQRRAAVRAAADGGGVERVDSLLRDRRGERSHRLRHRLGPRSGVAGRHDQRFRRGLSRSARREGRLGRHRLLREPGEDATHSRRWPRTRSGSRITCRGIRGSARPR